MTAFLDEAQAEISPFHLLGEMGCQTACGPDRGGRRGFTIPARAG